MDQHDTWNLWALGTLNIVHMGWWIFPSTGAVPLIFAADVAYILCDLAWLLLAPTCVAPRVRPGLLVHHLLMCACAPVAIGKPVLMNHLLRAWVVELQSWTHIAARTLRVGWLRRLVERVNKPLFVALRLVCFPLTWVLYSRERAALPAAVLAAHAPASLHVPLSLAHAAMYGLMVKWGSALLFGGAKKAA